MVTSKSIELLKFKELLKKPKERGERRREGGRSTELERRKRNGWRP
jgi:hypothetical protein